MVTFFVYLAVVIGGAAVLALELLGTRVLAPFYGASLYLWSALISVTLAALSVGYALGGRWADRAPTVRRLASVIGIAGLWIAVIPWLRLPVLSISESAGLRAAVLITATILFFPPLMLLGIVSPYAIRLRATSLGTVGRTAGNLYSISTIASVIAALLTGFVLIPNIGVSRLLFEIGFVLVATSILGMIIATRPRVAAVAAVALVVIGILVYRLAPVESVDPERGLLAIEQSAYGEIRVVDHEDLRYLVIDGGTHSVVDTSDWQSYFPYVNVLDLATGFFPAPGRMLLLGLGGGSVAKSFSRAGWKVDAVEIDPQVSAVARAHFGFTDKDAAVYVMDARRFLQTTQGQYDMVIMDVFGSSSIPFHLVTKEALALIHSHLVPGGVFAMNVIAVGWDDIFVRSLSATAKQSFANLSVLPIVEPPNHVGNVVLMASDRQLTLKDEPPAPQDRFSPEYDRVHAWDNRFEARPGDAPILTDDLNPVDVWAERINLNDREELHKVFKERGLTW